MKKTMKGNRRLIGGAVAIIVVALAIGIGGSGLISTFGHSPWGIVIPK